MDKQRLQSTMETFRLRVEEEHNEGLGKAAKRPAYERLGSSIQDPSQRSLYVLFDQAVQHLGRAMQLGQHRCLIDSLNMMLDQSTLTTMTAIALINPEVCAAFAVHLTTLEQSYHWPRDHAVTTPVTLEDHKLVIMVLFQSRLRKLLVQALLFEVGSEMHLIVPGKVAQTALTLGRSILDEIRLTLGRGDPIAEELQHTVNLLHRTCLIDLVANHHGLREFGRLIEVVRASGTERRLQEIFEDSGGLLCVQALPGLLRNLPDTSDALADLLTQLQYSIAAIREELASLSVDEVIWGRAFANASKAVGYSDLPATGGNAPVFWMLDSICGQTDPKLHGLPKALHDLSRYYPRSMQDLIARFRDAPALRAYYNSADAPSSVKQAFKALERQRYELYEMHRKKAARIAVSLRAGQRGTSAGVGCPYASPEKALGRTLLNGVVIRFGTDNIMDSVDATAHAHSQMFDEQGHLYSARVRFDFSTPLVLGPGDCLLVSVQDSTGTWQSRTYSVTYTYNCYKPLESDAHQLCRSAEVYVRSKGEISGLLCAQTEGCVVRIAVKPASHFRIRPNAQQEDTSIFIAQGGALGIFVAWLEYQSKLVGQYILIVAIRQLKQLGFTTELIRLASTLRFQLKIVVVLSKPAEQDNPFLLSKYIEGYHGRVNRYLDRQNFDREPTTYICGTSSFGLEVAKAQSLTDSTFKAQKRLEPIITSHLPPIRVHIAPEVHAVKALLEITLAELAQHNSPSDLWIAVGENVYDITALSRFHPGGEKILMLRAGLRADDIFVQVHGGSVEVESMMQNMIIGRLVPCQPQDISTQETMEKIVEIQNDLTNHSRFEKMPGQKDTKLNECAPTQVVYASVECFAREWCALLEDQRCSKSLQCQLMQSWLNLQRKLDAKQAAVYSESFDNVESCSQTLKEVFEHLREISAHIHECLDEIKTEIAGSISDASTLDTAMLEKYTKRLVMIINA